MKIYAKIENGIIKYPPKNDLKKGLFNVNKNEEWLIENGFNEYTQEELTGYQAVYTRPPKRYSTLKVIRTLGDQWETYRQQLELAGVLDQFFAANYLKEDDPIFQAFLETVPEELKMRLDECIWTE